MISCADAVELLDAFVDTELPSPTLLEVARHAGQCPRCDATVRELMDVRDALVADTDRMLEGLDLSQVWSRVDADITRVQGQAAWRQRVEARQRRVPGGLAVWGSLAAIAAGAALMLRTPTVQPGLQVVSAVPPAPVMRVADKRLPNHVYIDRLAGKDIALRREPKSGTTMIWVNHEVERSGW